MSNFDRKIIDDPQVFKVNTLPAHSDTVLYGSIEEMNAHGMDHVRTAGDSSLEMCLNGRWSFHYAENPVSAIEGFEKPVAFEALRGIVVENLKSVLVHILSSILSVQI